MAYDFYIGKMLFPVCPENVQVQINGRNETVTLINDGEINMLKSAGLTTGAFTLLLPNTPYPWARYAGGFQNAKVYLDYLEELKKESKVVQWIISRRFPSGKAIYDTNIQVALEDYTIRDDKKNAGFDTFVDVRLKQYKGYGTKTFSIDLSEAQSAPIVVPTERQPAAPPHTNPTPTNPKPESQMKDYKVQIPGMSVVQTKAKNEAEAISNTVPDYWKGTVYVNGVSYDAGTKKPAQPKADTTAKTETPKTTQEVAAKAEESTGKKQTKPIVDKGKPGINDKIQMVCLQ